MGEGPARLAMKYQRLQPGAAQPVKKILLPGRIAGREHAEARMQRPADRGMQIEVPARTIMVAIETGHRLLQPLRPLRLLAGRELPPALAKHPVHIAVQIAFIRPQRRRVTDDHQQPPAQGESLPDQPLHQPVDNLHRRRFVAMDGAGKHQPALAARMRRQLEDPLAEPVPAEMGRLAVKVMGQSPRQG